MTLLQVARERRLAVAARRVVHRVGVVVDRLDVDRAPPVAVRPVRVVRLADVRPHPRERGEDDPVNDLDVLIRSARDSSADRLSGRTQRRKIVLTFEYFVRGQCPVFSERVLQLRHDGTGNLKVQIFNPVGRVCSRHVLL